VIVLENVEEFQDWGPLLKNNKPCPDRKGMEFQRFVRGLKNLGYQVEWCELRACDYGAPTIRKRLFLIARCDGQAILWPEATHGEGKGLQPYNVAADCIDWSHPCHSIFLTKEEGKKVKCRRPLAENTMRRIAKGIYRYVLNSADPFIVMPAFITEHANASVQRNMPINQPLRTICAEVKGGHFALVSAFLAKHYTGVVGHEVTKPFGTVTGIDHHSVVTSNLVKLRNNGHGQDVRKPLHTITSGGGHFGEVRAFLVKYYGVDQDPRMNEPMHTVTSHDRFGLVTVSGHQYQVIDIGMRMLQPRELYRAQGFPDEYIITPEVNGRQLSKAAQVRMCGNSVSPPIAKAIVAANYSAIELRKKA
jgi:DNA (cytosine-5)-methyltransferase 1